METRGLADRSPRGRGTQLSAGAPETTAVAPRRFPLWLALVWAGVLALLYLALRQAPLAEIAGVLARLSAWQMAALMGTNAGILLLMTLRWGMILRAMGQRFSILRLVAYRLAGFGVSYFTPGPQFGGEPLQVHLLHREQAVPLSAAVSSVFLDRLVDLLANFTFLAVGGLVVVLSGLFTGWQGIGVFALAGGLLLLPVLHLLALWQGKRPAAWLARRLWLALRRPALHKAAEVASQAEGQIAAFLRETPWAFARVVALSALTWVAILFEFWLTLRFLGVSAGLVETVSVLTAARLAFLLPVPGGLGALEAGQALATSLLGWGPAVGVALSLLIRARDTLLAAIGLWVGGFAYRSVLFGISVSNERS